MSEDRIEAYRVDVYDMVFQMLDAEPDWNGDDAGRVATATSQAFEVAIRACLDADASDAFLASPPAGGICPTCGAHNQIVNECCCDPNNLPTKVIR